MVKKAFIALLFFVLLASSTAFGQRTMLLQAYYEQGPLEFGDSPFWTWSPENPLVRTDYDTGIFKTLYVWGTAGGRSYQSIIFDVSIQERYTELISTEGVQLSGGLEWRIYNNWTEKNNIDIRRGVNIISVNHPQDGVNQLLLLSSSRVQKVLLRRGEVGWWIIQYKGTNDPVPQALAIRVINILLDQGFYVEFSCKGWARSISAIYIGMFSVYITSIS